jgi:hypothetical protein
VRGIEHIPEEVDGIRFATVHGLLLYGFTHEPARMGKTAGLRAWLKRAEDWFAKRF